MDNISWLKQVLREEQVPFFSDEELNFYLDNHEGDLNSTAYDLLLIKAEDTTLSISGLSTADSSTYFRRLARRYKPNNSGTLKGD